MSITTIIPVPLVDQLNEPTMDGQSDENKSWNCVAASISSGLEFLTGKKFDGDELKDAVYGQGYTGGQAARDYVAYCHAQGVALVPFDGPPSVLIGKLHAEIQQRHPCLITMPSMWGIPVAQQQPGFTTHVALVTGEGPGELRAMNPWHGFFQDRTDADWQAELCDNEIWIMSALATGEVKMPAIPTDWSDSAKGDQANNSGVLTAPNGHKLVRGIRAFVLEYPGGWPADNYPIEDEHPQHVMELANPNIPDGVQQAFRRSVVEWIATDAPNGPKAGAFEMWVGPELLATRKALQVAQASLEQADQTIKQLQAQLAQQPTPPPALTQKQQLEIQIGEAIVALAKLP